MIAESVNILAGIFDPVRLFGPIFDKELRVSSRKKRNYILRSIYILLLMLFLCFVWITGILLRGSGSTLYQVSRLPVLGREITVSIIWIQFVVSQIIAIIMLSSSINDEIRAGTLNALMTTPINSFQIVTGKLLSKLLQILLLLGISLPLLALIRVFGGIPWQLVISSVCVTLTAIIFTGSLSLLCSTIYRDAYKVIVIIFLSCIIIWGVLPLLLFNFLSFEGYNYFVIIFNPFFALAAVIQPLPQVNIIWPIHCFVMLGCSLLFLIISMRRVRYVALNPVLSKKKKSKTKKAVKGGNSTDTAYSNESSDEIKRVSGSPVVWKELYNGYLGNRASKILYAVVIIILVISAILSCSVKMVIGIQIISFSMSVVYLIIMLRLAASTAGGIAREKEGRTLSILLVSPLRDREIILGKVKAALLKNLPLFILYFIQVIIVYYYYGASQMEHSQLLIQLPVAVFSIIGSALFISGCGMYFGVLTKTFTAAIVATIISYFVIVYIGFGIVSAVLTGLIMFLLRNQDYITWLSIFMSFGSLIFMGGTGLLFLKMAEKSLRKNIF